MVVQNETCFVTFEHTVSWFQARSECTNIDGHLASVESNDTQNALLGEVAGLRTNGFWFGLRRDKWVWTNGKPYK